MPKILLLTVTKVETQAVLDHFPRWKRKTTGDKIYYSLGKAGGADVYMVQSEMGAATPGGALITAHKAIEALQPAAVIMAGVAFGLRPVDPEHPDGQKLGDILVSKQIMAYEPGKVKGKFRPRGDRVTASTWLLDKFRSGDLDWPGPQPGSPRPAVHFGLVLSGEKLVNDLPFRAQLLDLEPEATGGEMEGAGVYVAASAARLDWILVKGICDWADGSKNDAAQPLAASNAASFVRHVLGQGGWEAHTPQSPEISTRMRTAGSASTQGPVYNFNGEIHAGRDVIIGVQNNRVTPESNPTTAVLAPNLDQLRSAYLAHLQNTYHALDFKGIPQFDNIAHELPIDLRFKRQCLGVDFVML